MNTTTIKTVLDNNESPVAKMRLLSNGLKINNRLVFPEKSYYDKGCLACGNCVDACPIVKEKQKFIFTQNLRTSMFLENIVSDECRRCYKCINSCPQVDKLIKEVALSFRRAEKIIHFLTAFFIVLLAITGISMHHYINLLPTFEANILSYFHRTIGILLLSIPFLYYKLDKEHFLRTFRYSFSWSKKEFNWIIDIFKYLFKPAKYGKPYFGEFNPVQKFWFCYIVVMLFPFLGITGIIKLFNNDIVFINYIHIMFAVITDVLLLTHIYSKYIRNWISHIFDLIKSYKNRKNFSIYLNHKF